jgi:hypothetical protein
MRIHPFHLDPVPFNVIGLFESYSAAKEWCAVARAPWKRAIALSAVKVICFLMCSSSGHSSSCFRNDDRFKLGKDLGPAVLEPRRQMELGAEFLLGFVLFKSARDIAAAFD